LATFYIKMIILPRQARDKHKNSAVFLQDLMERELARAELISKLRGAAAAAATAASAASGVPASNDNRRPHQQQQQQQQQQTSMLRSWEEAVTGIMQDCAAAEEVESEMLLACADNTSFFVESLFLRKTSTVICQDRLGTQTTCRKFEQKMAFSIRSGGGRGRGRGLEPVARQGRGTDTRDCERCEKRHLFFEISLCLSRACLGKMIDFRSKWLKNAVFRRGLRVA
jgi:hypothetical protein